MASQYLARLGIVLGIDSGELEKGISDAKKKFHDFKNQVEKDTKAAAREFEFLKNATEDYGKTLSKVEQIQREIDRGRFQFAAQNVKDKLIEQAKAYDAITASAKKTTFQMSEQQKMQLGFQLTDFVTQIASGQNAMIAFIQQGGQLKDSMGGVGNAFRAILSVLTPMRIAFGGIAASIGAIAFAFYEADKEADAFNDSLALTGRYAGITYDQFKSLSKQLSGETNTSIATVKDVMQAVVSSGQFTSQSLLSVTNAISTYAKVAGVSGKEAADKLMSGLDGSAAGAKRLNDQFNFLTLAQYKQIEALEATGKKQEAAQIVALAFNKSIEAHRREVGLLEKTWDDVTKAMQGYWNRFKDFIGPEDSSKAIERLKNEIVALEFALKKSVGVSNADKSTREQIESQIDSKRKELESILETQRLLARSRSGVGGEKGAIGEYSTNKSERLSAIRDAQKAEREAKFKTAYADANELERIELELQKKRDEALFKESQKNQDTFGRVSKEAARIRAAEIAIAEAEAKQQRKEYQWKKDVDEFDKETDILHRLMQERADIFKSVEEKRLNEDMTRKELNEKFSLLAATEKEIQLLKAKLEVEKEIEKLKLDNKFLNMSKDDQQKAIAGLEAVGRAKAANIELAESFKYVQNMYDAVWSNMSSAIETFVRTGKMSIKDFTRSVIQDMLIMNMKLQAMQLVRGLFSSFMSSSFSPVVSGGSDLSASSAAIMGRRAAGGPVSGGSPYLVGEQGPEIFMPAGSGTIVPNHMLANNAGGTTNVTNNYINAIDAKSFEQRLLESNQTIWSANQYASKNLATNFGRT